MVRIGMRLRRGRSLRPPWGGQLAGAQSARERVGAWHELILGLCPLEAPDEGDLVALDRVEREA